MKTLKPGEASAVPGSAALRNDEFLIGIEPDPLPRAQPIDADLLPPPNEPRLPGDKP